MGFFSGLFGGSNPTLNQGIQQAGQIAGFGQSKGEGLTTAAGNFFQDLMSGDPAKTAKLLAPQIASEQQRTQQKKQAMAQFGNRSGGTNAAAQTLDDKARANISTMISNLTGQAVTGAASMGKDLLSTGLDALNMQVGFSQQQMDNWANSILGRGITTGISGLESFGLGKL